MKIKMKMKCRQYRLSRIFRNENENKMKSKRCWLNKALNKMNKLKILAMVALFNKRCPEKKKRNPGDAD